MKREEKRAGTWLALAEGCSKGSLLVADCWRMVRAAMSSRGGAAAWVLAL